MDKAFNYYINWVLYSVFGQMAQADALLNKYKEEIHSVAEMFKERFDTPREQLYRGVMLEDEHIKNGMISHAAYETEYISFSADRRVALWFADKHSIMNSMLSAQRPSANGYIIQLTPERSDILFHYAWPIKAMLNKAAMLHPHINHSQFVWNLDTQKEVILKHTSALMCVDMYVSKDTQSLNNLFCHPEFLNKY